LLLVAVAVVKVKLVLVIVRAVVALADSVLPRVFLLPQVQPTQLLLALEEMVVLAVAGLILPMVAIPYLVL